MIHRPAATMIFDKKWHLEGRASARRPDDRPSAQQSQWVQGSGFPLERLVDSESEVKLA